MMTKHKNDNPILVTGAAGTVGGIGRNLSEFLLAKGHKVRALVRREDARAEALRRLGAEVVEGDLTDLPAMHRAIEGCGRIYFGMSVSSAYGSMATRARQVISPKRRSMSMALFSECSLLSEAEKGSVWPRGPSFVSCSSWRPVLAPRSFAEGNPRKPYALSRNRRGGVQPQSCPRPQPAGALHFLSPPLPRCCRAFVSYSLCDATRHTGFPL